MPMKKTFDEVYSYIQHVSDNDYMLISKEYKNSKEKLSIKHISCGHTFNMNFNNFSNGQRCPKCSKINSGILNSIGINDFKSRVSNITNGEYIVLSDCYKNNKTKIKFIHTKCNHEFETTPNNFLKTLSCPKCAYEKRAEKLKHTYNYVYEYIREHTNGEYILVSEDYKNTSEKIKIKHTVCGNIYDVSFGNFFMGSRCPKCFNSKGEVSIKEKLISLGIEFIEQYMFDDLIGDGNRKLRFDFAIIDNFKNVKYLIEYDGKFHFEKVHNNHDFEKQLKYDMMKNDYCTANNIKLIRIPYWEFKNIAKIIDDLTI